MARHFKAARVFRTAQKNLAVRTVASVEEVPPPWLKVVESIPPSEILTRPYPVQHQPLNPRARKPKNIFKPQQITFEEDEYRRTFFRDHPWELARPRMVIEMDGKDARRCDWSKGLRQPGIPLTGESVVQRQLWLMHNVPDITKEQAYDAVRREFYALRQEEEVERRIAQEEARMVGAYFGKSAMQVGMELEDAQFEKWKSWAATQTEKIEAERTAAYTSFGDQAETPDVVAEEQVV
ncbi:uncharacterized protein E0L32_003230 [Thyridium curvatum]|uniref:37S ribosomal protein S25, mitochondrial n=1 Tax=Thyridium curvatum TaxID=1093900 RepID=A0A507B4C6_9PEZI|nr:uncharacterized protein E0L32_003230 [Thyridium curvatum]TPX17112.1 hypothetical protein E0L32_003230 [Thyridium curvatum]